jgi:formamidopyrimidine-DNA glycosylase
MIELPEAIVLARQLNETLKGRKILEAEAGHSPHKFAWYTGDPKGYSALLSERSVAEARASAGAVEFALTGGLTVFFNDGPVLRYHKPGAKLPDKHQLMLKFDDGSALTASIQMYGGMMVFPDDQVENQYLVLKRVKPEPLSEAFDRAYFGKLWDGAEPKSMSVKAFLATDQRIPGIGNGVLQDILFNAGANPRRKMEAFNEAEIGRLFDSVKGTLADMAAKGGRDTETDLFGMKGGYASILSRNTVGTACPRCGGTIAREAYLGGNVYYCPGCQKK